MGCGVCRGQEIRPQSLARRISQTRCAPCFALARWFDDHREILEKDYVFLKIDDVRDLNGIRLAGKLLGDFHLRIPFHFILDADGNQLINSVGPIGNIGDPQGSFEGTQHMLHMIRSTRKRITDEDLQVLRDSLMPPTANQE